MMKLLLAVIATCALVVSPTCIKIKHQLRSNAPTIHVLISNGNTQMTSQVGRNGSHRFITDNLSSMTLAPAGSQTITLSYDQIFPITDAAVCTEVHPLSAGGCADGVCCKISISMYTITDAIIMTARVNNRNADGNPQFWKCEQEFQVPGVTNTELSPKELVTDILASESNIGEVNPGCDNDGDCGNNTHCDYDRCECNNNFGQKAGDTKNCYVVIGHQCYNANQCGNNTLCLGDGQNGNGQIKLCKCKPGYEEDTAVDCKNIDECMDGATCKQMADGSVTGNKCIDNTPSDTEPRYTCECDDTDYYKVMMQGGLATCTECPTCGTYKYCSACVESSDTTTCGTYYADSLLNANVTICCKACTVKGGNNAVCTQNYQCHSNLCHSSGKCRPCNEDGDCNTTGETCTAGVCGV